MQEAEFATVVGGIVGISEVVKRVSNNTVTKYIPVLNLGLGIAAGLFYLSPGDTRKGVLLGIFAGLSASGAYSGGKNVFEGLKTKEEQGE